jgi:hypothetical protein
MAFPAPWLPLSEVGFHHVDHLIGRESLFRIWPSLGVKDVVPDVAFEELGHEAIDRSSGRTDDLQYLRAIPALIENSFQSLKLTTNALASQNELLLVFDCVTHSQQIISWSI